MAPKGNVLLGSQLFEDIRIPSCCFCSKRPLGNIKVSLPAMHMFFSPLIAPSSRLYSSSLLCSVLTSAYEREGGVCPDGAATFESIKGGPFTFHAGSCPGTLFFLGEEGGGSDPSIFHAGSCPVALFLVGGSEEGAAGPSDPFIKRGRFV